VAGTFFGATAWADRRFEAEAAHDPIAPGIVPERAAALDTAANRLQFGCCLRHVHVIDPVGLAGERPGRKELAVFRGAALPAEKAGPLPLFGFPHEIRSQRVSLHVACERVKVVVFLNGKRLEAALVNVARSARMTMRMPALGVRQCQPADKPREFALLSRPDNEVPVVRHEAIGQQPGLCALHGLGQRLLEREVIRVVVEDAHPRIGPVEHVVHVTTLSGPSRWASHGCRFPILFLSFRLSFFLQGRLGLFLLFAFAFVLFPRLAHSCVLPCPINALSEMLSGRSTEAAASGTGKSGVFAAPELYRMDLPHQQ
jgi:hypothetical protein